MFREYKVKDIMDKDFVKVKPDDTIMDVAKKMKKAKASEAIVVDGKEVMGIVTLRDIVYGMAAGKKLEDEVLEVMSSELIVGEEGESVMDALKKMRKYNIGRLPVIDKNNKLIGIITEKTIINTFPSILEVMEEEAKINEGGEESASQEEEIMEGVCESCGNYSETLRNKDGSWLCEECYKEEGD